MSSVQARTVSAHRTLAPAMRSRESVWQRTLTSVTVSRFDSRRSVTCSTPSFTSARNFEV